MVLAPDRITLCGITVITDKGTEQAMMMLAELAKKERGRFVRRSAEDLKKAIGADSVQTITGCAKTIRVNIHARLKKELGLLCGDQDVLVRDGQGYHLQDWIEVGGAEAEGGAVDTDPAGETAAPAEGQIPEGEPTSRSADTEALNERQRWVLDRIRTGQNVRRTELESAFGVSSKTAKRDLEALVKTGRIEFIRKPHPGFYRGKRV